MIECQNAPLDQILLSRRWIRREKPFPHLVGRDVFTPDAYKALWSHFATIEARGFSEHTSDGRFGRSTRGYDAYSYSLTPDIEGPLQLFASRPWHDLVARMMGINATGEITAGLHYHAAGSADGKIHNDLNPGWFRDQDVPADSVALSDWRRWSYFDGSSPEALTVRERIRAVTVIFYLGNPLWRPGDGGMTGLYLSAQRPVNRPDVSVPPVNNTMLVFECGALSYHSFIGNRNPRRSVILWLHRTREEAVARWGEQAIINWR
jgi:hypothetical protein